jgi:hypothetical protein
MVLQALVAGGCGLADYEEQMAEAQERVERFDKENKVLGDPLAPPTKVKEEKVGDGQPRTVLVTVANIFLRAPKGIQVKAEDEPYRGLLYHYPAAGPAGPDAVGFTDLYVAAAGDDLQKFQEDVLRAFPTDGKPRKYKRSIAAPGRADPLEFDVTEFDSGDHTYVVHFYPTGRPTLALVYRLARGRRQSADPVLELSLATFAAGPEADRLRQSYNQRRALAQSGGQK